MLLRKGTSSMKANGPVINYEDYDEYEEVWCFNEALTTLWIINNNDRTLFNKTWNQLASTQMYERHHRQLFEAAKILQQKR
jgi:hypothetical protein